MTMSSKMMQRFFLVIAMLSMACKNEAPKGFPKKIKTYALEALSFPEEKVIIPKSMKQQFRHRFFAPWTVQKEDYTSLMAQLPGKDLDYLENYLADDAWYGENKRPHKKAIRQAIVQNALKENFPNFIEKAIVVSHTDVRRIPSHKPGFDSFRKAGEGYPFDYFQETGLWANTPVLLLHQTADKQWCYVLSAIYKGWVPMKDLALVNDSFIEKWMESDFCMPLSDTLVLSNPKTYRTINAKMGMVLPYRKIDDQQKLEVMYAVADAQQKAVVFSTPIAPNLVGLDDLGFDVGHLRQLISNVLEKPYGWGGDLGNRDCSSMIRDILGTYRIWLPRDSKDQVTGEGFMEFPDDRKQKLQLIKEQGVPFLTILRKKGHNMLYVGNNDKGEPLILHAIWGLRTNYTDASLVANIQNYPIEGIHMDESGTLVGRYIFGESVITSVMAGVDNDPIVEPLIDEIYGMVNVLKN